jgi:hypothetical protein
MSAVYVDDFLLAAVENAKGTLLKRTAWATLHTIHSIFPPPAATGTPDAKDPVSENKLQKGDAQWDSQNEILGYWFDGKDRTVQLPPHQAVDLLTETKNVLRKRRVPLA